MFSQHLPRWVFASVTSHFLGSAQGIQTYIEGQIKEELTQDYYEIRMNGPMLDEISKSVWSATVGVNIFVSSLINNENFHRIHEMVGIMASAYTDIGIYKYGPTDTPSLLELNDSSLVGCLNVGQITISHFGQLDPARPIMRATVDSEYTGLLYE